jgi:hypothetical protein
MTPTEDTYTLRIHKEFRSMFMKRLSPTDEFGIVIEKNGKKVFFNHSTCEEFLKLLK